MRTGVGAGSSTSSSGGFTRAHAKLDIAHESWPIAGGFTISRGSKTSAEVVTVTLEHDGAVGRGECVPYARYGETVEATIAALEAARSAIERGSRATTPPRWWHPRRRATRSTARCGIWRPSAPGRRPGSAPD
jgi:L-Ala-D/L-Glu epimerase